jgi:hypothetical protein
MALPLLALLAGGMGVLGGGQYLLNKQDASNSQQKAKGLMDWLPTSGIAPQALQGIMAQAQAEADSAGASFMDTGSTRRVNNLWSQANAASINQAQESLRMGAQQAQWDQMNVLDKMKAKAQMASQGLGNRIQIENDIQADGKAVVDEYGKIQQMVRGIIPKIDDGSITPMETYEASVRALQSMFPGEAIMEGDFSALRAAGGKRAELAAWLQRWSPGGTTPPDANFIAGLRGILSTAHDEARRRYDEVSRWQTERANRQGVDIRNIQGGGGVDTGYSIPSVQQTLEAAPRAPLRAGPARPRLGPNGELPAGFTVWVDPDA